MGEICNNSQDTAHDRSKFVLQRGGSEIPEAGEDLETIAHRQGHCMPSSPPCQIQRGCENGFKVGKATLNIYILPWHKVGCVEDMAHWQLCILSDAELCHVPLDGHTRPCIMTQLPAK